MKKIFFTVVSFVSLNSDMCCATLAGAAGAAPQQNNTRRNLFATQANPDLEELSDMSIKKFENIFGCTPEQLNEALSKAPVRKKGDQESEIE